MAIFAVENRYVLHILMCVLIPALVIWHAKSMYLIILSSVTCQALPFSHYLRTARVSEKQLNTKCVCSFLQNSQKISHSKKNSVIVYYKCNSVFILSTPYSLQILMKIGFSRQILGKSLNILFMKIRPLKRELSHVDRQT